MDLDSKQMHNRNPNLIEYLKKPDMRKTNGAIFVCLTEVQQNYLQ